MNITLSRRFARLLAGVGLLGISTVLATRLPPEVAASRSVPAFLAWWLQPIDLGASRRLHRVDVDFHDVFALPDTGDVWAVGDGGLILHSADGGTSWERQFTIRVDLDGGPIGGDPPPTEPLVREQLSQPAANPAVATEEPAESPQASSEPKDPARILPGSTLATDQSLETRYPADPKEPSPGGVQVEPRSGGPPALADPELRRRLAGAALRTVYFTDARHGWVAGDHGALWATTDGGRTWQWRPPGGDATLRDVFFQDRLRGWAVGDFSSVLETLNGGESWDRLGDLKRGGWTSVRGTGKGLLIAGEGRVLGLSPGTSGALARALDVSEPTLRAIDATDDFFWVLTNRGLVRFSLGREDASPRETLTYPGASLFAIDFLDIDRGWAVGDQGIVVATDDAGLRWTTTRLRGAPDLRAVSFASSARGYVAGTRGNLIATYTGGAIWRPVTGWLAAASGARGLRWHWALPAPWYYLSLLLGGLVLAPALRRPPPEIAARPSVADMLVSDRPIEDGEADAFDLSRIALGLSYFLRNANTQPPLTLAVTGEWGSGKSSLMNLLKGDLARRGFQPVWFNAWHHQKEEHLLASLLENVRAQAIPPWARWEGLAFRGRLLGIRWRRYWLIVVLLFAVLASLAGYFRADPVRIDAARTTLAALAKRATDPPGSRLPVPGPATAATPAKTDAPPASPAAESAPLLALLAAVLGLLVSLWRGLKSFGANPASLLAHASARSRVRDLAALTGFRHRFAAEFRDVTSALNPRTMTILIDDLDRCRPQMVLEVLEAVNFLASSGDCFVVMGMARERVERCVGLSFKDVADELLDPPSAPVGLVIPSGEAHAGSHDAQAQEAARQRRTEFARQYLEKLINIEVPVPVPTGEQSRRLMAHPRSEEAGSRWQRILTGLQKAAPPTVVLALIACCFVVGSNLGRPAAAPAASPKTGPAAQAAQPADPEVRTDPAHAEGPATRRTPEPAAIRRPARVEPGERARWPTAVLLLLGIGVLGVGVWRLAELPAVVENDSPAFTAALERWHPVVFGRRSTPRAVKRFLNRVRCLAMLQRSVEEEPAGGSDPLARLRRRLRRGPTQTAAPATDAIPEEILVALAAIDYSFPSSDPASQLGNDEVTAVLLGSSVSQEALLAHLPTYLKLSAGIHVR